MTLDLIVITADPVDYGDSAEIGLECAVCSNPIPVPEELQPHAQALNGRSITLDLILDLAESHQCP